MRPGVFVVVAALLLAIVAGQNTLLQPTKAQTTTASSAITACAVQGESCSQPSLDSTPGTVVSYVVFKRGCAGADLHVMRYVSADQGGQDPIVATWCS